MGWFAGRGRLEGGGGGGGGGGLGWRGKERRGRVKVGVVLSFKFKCKWYLEKCGLYILFFFFVFLRLVTCAMDKLCIDPYSHVSTDSVHIFSI